MKNLNVGFRPVRAYLQSGAFGAAPLGEFKDSPKRKPAGQLCRKHKWRESRWTRTCTRCAFTEYKV